MTTIEERLDAATSSHETATQRIHDLLNQLNEVATVAEAEAAADKLLTAQVLSQISENSSLSQSLIGALFGNSSALVQTGFAANRADEVLGPGIVHIEHSWQLTTADSSLLEVDPGNSQNIAVKVSGTYLFRLRADFGGASFPETYKVFINGQQTDSFTTSHGGSVMGAVQVNAGQNISLGRLLLRMAGQPAPGNHTSHPSNILFFKIPE